MKLSWNFQSGKEWGRAGGVQTKKTMCGEGMDVLWNNTLLNSAWN